MINLFDKLIDILYPRKCINCNTLLKIKSDNKWFCDNCKYTFKILDAHFFKCKKCGRIIEHIGKCRMCNELKTHYDNGFCTFAYENIVREAIIRYKFENMTSYAEYFSSVMAEYIVSKTDVSNYDYITCVPLYKSKEMQRGYNQAKLLAKGIAIKADMVYKVTLVKVINTKQQSTLSAKEREINIKNAFECCADIKGKNILIVDDILTTGYTINECCKILKKAGADRVDFAVLACVNGEK